MQLSERISLPGRRLGILGGLLALLAAFAFVGVSRASAADAFPPSLQSATPVQMPVGAPTTLFGPFGFIQEDGFRSVGVASTSCGTTGSCVSVGGYLNTNDSSYDGEDGSGPADGGDFTPNFEALVVPSLNGVAQPAVEVELPDNAIPQYFKGDLQLAELNDVSCWGASSCVAVGTYSAEGDGDGTEEPMVVSITNGVVTQAIEAPLPANEVATDAYSNYTTLNSVSCTPSGSCVAVGTYVDGNGNEEAFVVGISGAGVPAASASEVTLPSNALLDSTGAQNADLNGVSCEASGCVAVGSYEDNGGVADATSGNGEALVVGISTAAVPSQGTELSLPGDARASTPESNPEAELDAVSCPAAGTCAAGGSYDGNVDYESMVAMLSPGGSQVGTATELLAPANADSSTDLEWNALSCWASSSCVVVGAYYDDNGDSEPLAIPITSAGVQSAVEVTVPGDAMNDTAGYQDAALYGVSCSSTGSCLATGSYTGDESALASFWWDGDLPPVGVYDETMLVPIVGGSVGAATTAPVPSDAFSSWPASGNIDPFLYFQEWENGPEFPVASIGCGQTGSCVAIGEYLQASTGWPGGRPAVFQVSAQAPLTITTSSLTAATAGFGYSAGFAATGGWGPYTWSAAGGNGLPPGLYLNPLTGVLSGTPTTAGTYTVWVQATSAGSSGTATGTGSSSQVAYASVTFTIGSTAATSTVTVTPISPAAAKSVVPSVIVVRGNLRDHNGSVKVHLRCHSAARCHGNVKLRWHGHVISRLAHFSIPAGTTRGVLVHLNAAGLKDTSHLRKPKNGGDPTLVVTVAPKLNAGFAYSHTRPMWVMSK